VFSGDVNLLHEIYAGDNDKKGMVREEEEKKQN